MNRYTTGITIEVDDDEETIEALYNHESYPSGVNTTDVEAYWSDDEIKEAIAEMNNIAPQMIEITRL